MAKHNQTDTWSLVTGTMIGMFMAMVLGPKIGGILGFFITCIAAGLLYRRLVVLDIFKGFIAALVFVLIIRLKG